MRFFGERASPSLLACLLAAARCGAAGGFAPPPAAPLLAAPPGGRGTAAAALPAAEAVNGSAEGGEPLSPPPPAAIRLNVPEKARTVTATCTSGTLCTSSSADGIGGAPFGSFVDYVLDDAGRPVLLMNDMSAHTRNIREAGPDGLVTLFCQLGGAAPAAAAGGAGRGGAAPAQSQDVSRCSVTGTISEADPSSDGDLDVLRARYGVAHAYADQVMDSPKFRFWRLEPLRVYFVGGFGVSSEWVSPEEYREASPDVLAGDAAGIKERLNRDHPADLLLTASEILGEDADAVERARVTGVDRLGMDVRVTSRARPGRGSRLVTDEYRVGFRTPVGSVEDAKSEILKVFQEAWERREGVTWPGDGAPGADVPFLKTAEDNLM